MTRILAGIVFLVLLYPTAGKAQDTLPKFTAALKSPKRILISWTNPYPVVHQVSIQRSLDSTRNFKTILTVPDPTVAQNGFVDSKAPTPTMFYRLFILLDSGKYIFTKSERPVWDTARAIAKPGPSGLPGENNRVIVSSRVREQENEKEPGVVNIPPIKKEPVIVPEKFFYIKKRDSLLAPVSEKRIKRFRDSVVMQTKDTLFIVSADTIEIRPFVPKPVYRPSKFVYTGKDGNVVISLPDVPTRKYQIKFFEEDDTPLFEIREVRESPLVLDKTNFAHSGWFRFELYDNGKLKEKHKFFIPKDF